MDRAYRPGPGRRALLGTVLATTASGFAGHRALGQPAVLRLPRKFMFKAATIVAESFPYVDGLKAWKKAIEARTGGMVDFQIFHTAQLGDERTINEGILAGSIQIGIGAGAWAGFVPAYNVVELPFLIRDLQHMYRLADGRFGEQIADHAASKGFKVLTYYSAGEQHFQSRRSPIQSLQDFRGLKMRVIQNRALVDGFKALGAVPVPLPYPEIYTALQQGTVDGTANDFPTVISARLYEVVRHCTLSSYVIEPRPVIMSRRIFDGLPKELQQVLVDTAEDSAKLERQVFETQMQTARAELERRGVAIAELSDRDKWIEAIQPVWSEFGRTTPGASELIRAAQDLV
ncbi:TRAP transporter substrate-binding protein [Roseomonas chloroacetimidivorans]|uniref:TRAP transporter substrate-binding protein n=1 Tax=Roseomonas chloroacetimidivorans TaxID=1766656 RepID=UPI003C740EB4